MSRLFVAECIVPPRNFFGFRNAPTGSREMYFYRADGN